MSAINFEAIDIAYGDFHVVKNLDLEIADNEFVVLVGPSGCGKSTILRLVAGFESVHSGKLSIGDRIVNTMEPKDRNVSMVFQNYALYPHMTVRENIAFGMKIRKMQPAHIEQQIDEVVGVVNLRDQLDKKPGALSGGQRQRVALARAIVRHPEVFLFDEPLSNLDAEFRTSMRQEIARLHRRLQTTMVYVTHDQVEAMTMGDKIAVLAPIATARQSNLMQFGTPEELYLRPSNLFVAKFIGSPPMNLIEISADSNPLVTNTKCRTLSETLQKTGAFYLGIRPEHLMWGETKNDLCVQGRVKATENLGHEYIVFVETSLGDLTIRLPDHHENVSPGDTCSLGLPLERAHLFEVETEQRIEH